MSHADDLFDEADKADQEAATGYNPQLSLSQLLAPTPDAKLAEMSDDNLVRVEVTVVDGAHTTIFTETRVVKTGDLHNQVFVSGRVLCTRLLEAVPLTLDEAKIARKVLGL
jgi:hypothetical protein